MVIDIVLHYLSGRGGTESVLRSAINEFSRRGHRVRIVQCYDMDYKKWLPKKFYELYHLFNRGGLDQMDFESFVERYRKFIDESGKPDIILATGAPLMSYLCHLTIKDYLDRVPVISWLHNPISSFNFKEAVDYADAHLAISREICNEIEKRHNENIHLIYNPVNIDVDIVERDESKLNLLYLGRLSEGQKRIDVLLRGLIGLDEEWSLDIIGDGKDKTMLQKLARHLCIENKIKWHGWSEEPWNEVKKASVLVLTSDFEGFGLVVVEALARGIPVISTRCGIAEDIIKDDVNGWLINKGDYDGLNNILKDIQKGKKRLPSKESCIDSVTCFREDSVFDKVEKSILLEVVKKKMKCLRNNK